MTYALNSYEKRPRRLNKMAEGMGVVTVKRDDLMSRITQNLGLDEVLSRFDQVIERHTTRDREPALV